MKIATVIGARPQFIKAATVSRIIKKRDDTSEIVIHTGQHYDPNMSDIFFSELSIQPPDYNLGINCLAHGAMTGRQLEAIEKVLITERPDWVLVYGDTNSTLAGALAAVKLHIPVAHIEAGLRSFNRRMPEEINRILTDHCSELLFAPTQTAAANLAKEGIQGKCVQLVGDVMLDAARFYGKKANTRKYLLDELGVKPKAYILTTIHRAENTDNENRITQILKALIEVAEEFPVILPLHPRTRKALEKYNQLTIAKERLNIIDPVGYLDMVMLEKNALTIITDSGGIQKEAYFHHVPCITLRDETEWIDLVDNGFNILHNIENMLLIDLLHEMEKVTADWDIPIFGNGDAANNLIDVLRSF